MENVERGRSRRKERKHLERREKGRKGETLPHKASLPLILAASRGLIYIHCEE